ncbi:MAG: right-handed parallel beta-helix repeat-containing protein [Candidatus Binatia bacterium]
MFQKFLLVIGIAIFMGMAFSSPTLGAPCGGNTVCVCGDTVEADRTLTGADPVLNAVCPGDGLIMNTSGVTLNLRGERIKGDGGAGDVGIRILDGVNNIEIVDGEIREFGTGIKSQGTTTGSTIKEIGIKGSTLDGMDIWGTGNIFENNRQLAGNGGDGMRITGDDNFVTLNRAVENVGDGIVVIGNHNDISEKNQSSNNKGNGMYVEGNDNAILDNNQIHHNKGYGLRVIGTGNIITRNMTNRDGPLGILVTGLNAVDGNNIDGGGNNSNQGPKYLTSSDCEIDGNACLP